MMMLLVRPVRNLNRLRGSITARRQCLMMKHQRSLNTTTTLLHLTPSYSLIMSGLITSGSEWRVKGWCLVRSGQGTMMSFTMGWSILWAQSTFSQLLIPNQCSSHQGVPFLSNNNKPSLLYKNLLNNNPLSLALRSFFQEACTSP